MSDVTITIPELVLSVHSKHSCMSEGFLTCCDVKIERKKVLWLLKSISELNKQELLIHL